MIIKKYKMYCKKEIIFYNKIENHTKKSKFAIKFCCKFWLFVLLYTYIYSNIQSKSLTSKKFQYLNFIL